jgi:hypothetical protein
MEAEKFEQSYKDLIKQHLPEQVSEALRTQLDLVDTYSKEISKLESIVETRDKELKTLTDLFKVTNSDLEIFKSKDKELSDKEAKLTKMEAELTLREIRVLNEITRKEMAEKHSEDFKNVLTTVFANKQVFESITETQNGQWHYNSQNQRNEFLPDGNKSTTIIKS